MFHAFQWLDADPATGFWIGEAGVDVFFVISGFIIWTVAGDGQLTPGQFLWRRFTRVAPSYWLATGVVAIIALTSPMFLPQISVTPGAICCYRWPSSSTLTRTAWSSRCCRRGGR